MKSLAKYYLTLFALLVVGFYSCSNSTNKRQTKKVKVHERLLNCKTEFVTEDEDEVIGYYENYEEFIKDYFSEEQKDDTLIVTTLFNVNACGETIGDIEFLGDTLFLKTRQIADEFCASGMFEKFTYKIYNPDKIKYEIQSER